jgi:hypothetical protein
MDSGNSSRPPVIVAVIAIVILVFVVGKSGGVNGLAGNTGCGTNESYKLPKDQFNGIGVSLTVKRCKTSSAKAKSYVLATVDVDGNTKTVDGSTVKDLKTSVLLYSQVESGKAYRRIPLSETPNDTGVTLKGSSVAYHTERRWNTPSKPSQVSVKLALTTDKGASTAEHVFGLP